jgi:hypothetical protein
MRVGGSGVAPLIAAAVLLTCQTAQAVGPTAPCNMTAAMASLEFGSEIASRAQAPAGARHVACNAGDHGRNLITNRRSMGYLKISHISTCGRNTSPTTMSYTDLGCKVLVPFRRCASPSAVRRLRKGSSPLPTLGRYPAPSCVNRLILRISVSERSIRRTPTQITE